MGINFPGITGGGGGGASSASTPTFFFFFATDVFAGSVWTNMPASETEFQARTAYRRTLDLRNFSSIMLVVSLGGAAGATNAVLKAQYSTDSGSNWSDLTGTASINTVNVVTDSGTAAIPAGAKIENCLVRLVGSAGDGAADPNIISAYFVLT